MAKRRCKAKAKATGKRCRNTAVLEDGYCVAHTPNTADSRRLKGGAKPGAGHPRHPRVVDEMRRRVEADVETILAPYFEAIREAVMFVKYEGELVVTDTPDLGARIAAAEKLLDRVYGRPAQAIELAGPDGGPIAAEILTVNAKEASDAAHDFLERLAGAEH